MIQLKLLPRETLSVLILLWLISMSMLLRAQKTEHFPENSVILNGYLGSRIDQCIHNQVEKQQVDELVAQFKTRNEKKLWQTEFWGKWMLSAVESYKYCREAKLLDLINHAADELMKTQTSDGYIGNYSPAYRLQGWDIWGQKYTLLGLLSYYKLTHEQRSLTSACLLADNLINQLQSTGTNISKTGKYRGMPSSSVLEPIVMLYSLTGNNKYLDFAKYIVGTWEKPDGPALISAAINGIPVGDRFKTPKIWWSWDNGEKAYEMISCYDGLLDLYRITKDSVYLKAVELAAQDIIRTEINIVGSGTSMECFYHGAARQTEPAYHTQETCFTFSWMKLCYNLLKCTGNPMYADQLEKTAYNAMLASLNKDGSEFAKYTPLEGFREAGEQQCGMDINCCNANGPRGLMLMPQWSVMKTDEGILINGFEASKSRIFLNKKDFVDIEILSDFPKTDSAKIRIYSSGNQKFNLKLRIPSWSDVTEISLDNLKTDSITKSGYAEYNRKWNQNTMIKVRFAMQPRLVKRNGFQAITRGPVVLARDSRFNDGFVDESIVFPIKTFSLKPQSVEGNFWMIFTTNGLTGTNLEGTEKAGREIHFCDFASAGNNWKSNTRYRVWMKETINVMHDTYVPY